VKRLLRVEYFDDETPIKVYTVRFLDDNGPDEETETNKFLLTYSDSHKDEIDIFLSLLNIMQTQGVKENFLRNERNEDCRYLFALLNQDEEGNKYTGSLRLFCLYYGDNKLILGNGSFKTTAKFQQDENLKLIAKDLQELDKVIRSKLDTGEIWWEGSDLKTNNNLNFEIEV